MAVAVFTSVRWQASAPLAPRHLTKTRFALLAEGLHALPAAAVLDHESIMLLREAVFLNAHFATTSIFTMCDSISGQMGRFLALLILLLLLTFLLPTTATDLIVTASSEVVGGTYGLRLTRIVTGSCWAAYCRFAICTITTKGSSYRCCC